MSKLSLDAILRISSAGLPLPAHDLVGDDLGAEVTGRSDAPATAFSQAWSRAGWTRPELRNEAVMGKALRTVRYRYVEWDDGARGVELYDYELDPTETVNLAAHEDYAPVMRAMKTKLDRVRGANDH